MYGEIWELPRSQVLAANQFSPSFRRYLGVSGKLAIVVMSSLAAFSAVSENTLVDESRRIRHQNYRQRHNITDTHNAENAASVAGESATVGGGEYVAAPHAAPRCRRPRRHFRRVRRHLRRRMLTRRRIFAAAAAAAVVAVSSPPPPLPPPSSWPSPCAPP